MKSTRTTIVAALAAIAILTADQIRCIAQDFHGSTTMTTLKTGAVVSADAYTTPTAVNAFIGRASVLLACPAASSGDTLDVSLQSSEAPTMILDERNTALSAVDNKLKPASGQTKVAAVFTNTGADQINAVGLRLKKAGTITAGKIVTVTIEAVSAATLSTSMTGANNDITLTANTVGVGGNAISLTLVDPSGNNEALAVTVSTNDISVSLATDGMGAITTTASELLAAINADDDANDLVTVTLKGADTGAGVVTALTKTSLAGGGPSGSALATDTIDIDSEITTSYAWVTATFTTLGELATGTYAIVAAPDYDASDSNYVSWANGVVGSGGTFHTYSGSAWSATATKDLMLYVNAYQFAAVVNPYNAADTTYGKFTQVTASAPAIERIGLYIPPEKRYIRALLNVTGTDVTVYPSLVILGRQ